MPTYMTLHTLHTWCMEDEGAHKAASTTPTVIYQTYDMARQNEECASN